MILFLVFVFLSEHISPKTGALLKLFFNDSKPVNIFIEHLSHIKCFIEGKKIKT